MKIRTMILTALLAAATSITAQAEVIRSGAFEADLDAAFPSLRSLT